MDAGDAGTGDLKDIRAFCLVVDLGSVTAAASALGETKGSVSRRLTRLERAVGARLIHRSPRSVQPSEEGVEYRARIGRALEMFDDATAALQQRQEAPSGLLRVSAKQVVAVGLLAPVVGRFHARYPDVGIDMIITDRHLDFDAEHLDLAFVGSQGPLPDSPLVGTRILDACDFDLGLFASPAYLKERPGPRSPEEIERHALLLPFGGQRDRDATFMHRKEPARRMSIRIRATVSSNDAAFVRELAISGGGLAFMMRGSVDQDLTAGRLVEVLQDWHFAPSSSSAGVFMLHRGGPFVPPKVRAFREFVLEALGRNKPAAGISSVQAAGRAARRGP